MSSELLVVRGLSAEWDRVPVLRDVDVDVGPHELVTLLGPNGSGKTTLLRCLAGLERPRSGSIRLGGREIGALPTHRRGIGMVPQEPSLFPHRTVVENVAYGLLVQRRPDPEVRARVAGLLERLDLGRFAARYPAELSGGEQQRVALARALAPDPELVLLDEPFASVDPEYRAELRSDFRRILRDQGTAALHVTHDREEGLYLGERTILLLAGRVAQVGSPSEVFDRPASPEVARFLGYNLVTEGPRTTAVAPEDVAIDRPGPGRRPATVEAIGPVGRDWWVRLRLEDGTVLSSRFPRGGPAPEEGSRVGVRFDRERSWGPGAA